MKSDQSVPIKTETDEILFWRRSNNLSDRRDLINQAIPNHLKVDPTQTMYASVVKRILKNYEAQQLPPPSLDRPWLGAHDFVQCRLLNMANGIFARPPLECLDLPN